MSSGSKSFSQPGIIWCSDGMHRMPRRVMRMNLHSLIMLIVPPESHRMILVGVSAFRMNGKALTASTIDTRTECVGKASGSSISSTRIIGICAGMGSPGICTYIHTDRVPRVIECVMFGCKAKKDEGAHPKHSSRFVGA